MMTGWEMGLPDSLRYNPLPPTNQSIPNYTHELEGRMRAAHHLLQKQQNETVGGDRGEPLRFMKNDLVLLENRRRRKGESSRLHPPFMEPFIVKEAYNNHTYKIDKQGQTSVQNEGRLKLFRPSNGPKGQTPVTKAMVRQPNM